MAGSQHVIEEALALCLQRIDMEEDRLNAERKFIDVVKNFEAVRKKWLNAELELKKYKELVVKLNVANAALEVKLKHTRNQLDVEMRKRYKIEADYHYLERQMQLMCDILVHDSKSSACLNDEQKTLLAAFDHKGGNVTLHKSSRRLSVIDESSFLSHSDISYDRTDDDVDLDTTVIKPLRSRPRERRRSSMGPAAVCAPVMKRRRGGNGSAELLERKPVDKEVETIVKASVMTPETGGQIHMVVGITHETHENPVQTMAQECLVSVEERQADETSVWSPCDESVVELQLEKSVAVIDASPGRAEKTLKHDFVTKTVIMPEKCSPCGKRIRFGRMVVKCRNCRAVAHPECQQKVTEGCFVATAGSSTPMVVQDSLEAFTPVTYPRVPHLVRQCVTEIERRGLQEKGLYRVPGGERLVKGLRDQFLQGRTPLTLNKVQDIHVVCGLLKDFLRKLKEPLITFALHRTFMEAAEQADEDVMYKAIAELPKANRDTLAFLLLHLHKVRRSPHCQMDQNNLARVFGPTVVGHGMSEPSPRTILKDINTQPKVIYRLLSLPEEYWRGVLADTTDQVSPSTGKADKQDSGQGFFLPLTSPELNSYYKTGRGSHKIRTNIQPGKKFFTSLSSSSAVDPPSWP
ncbi:Rac GTPase-activating protein 1 Male germ cell RacGap [Channa argus]|uniref:Rac GTPase-activating protein 1 Male germ cell RacGap n=1 Tax=Channa argus TaxID=215402 RepID=A0A6G1PMX9_CHAAH|nr:Rac GTPase-activating protein 1 Male germ cell RacGap [Channa argus]